MEKKKNNNKNRITRGGVDSGRTPVASASSSGYFPAKVVPISLSPVAPRRPAKGRAAAAQCDQRTKTERSLPPPPLVNAHTNTADIPLIAKRSVTLQSCYYLGGDGENPRATAYCNQRNGGTFGLVWFLGDLTLKRRRMFSALVKIYASGGTREESESFRMCRRRRLLSAVRDIRVHTHARTHIIRVRYLL